MGFGGFPDTTVLVYGIFCFMSGADRVKKKRSWVSFFKITSNERAEFNVTFEDLFMAHDDSQALSAEILFKTGRLDKPIYLINVESSLWVFFL